MEIFYSATSPYARIARIAAIECDVTYEDNLVNSELLRTDDNPVLKYNCTGRVPTLVDNNVIVTETRSVCRYLESIGNGTRMFTSVGDWNAEQLESTAISLLDGCALWTREYRRPQTLQSDWLISVERERAERSLDWLNSAPGIVDPNPPWDFAHITLAIAIEYQEYKGLISDWTTGREKLTSWFEAQIKRPAMKITALPPN